MDSILQRSHALKQALTDFVLDAEGELAIALETFSAANLARSQQTAMHQRNLVVDRFLAEGKVGDLTPIDLFVTNEPELSDSDRALLDSWHRAFVGLFEVIAILPDGFVLTNWTTKQQYRVKPTDESTLQAMARLKVGEIVLTQIAPLSAIDWMLFSQWISLGKLGKPKLAVAIGNFKQNYKSHLYSDAPELLVEAWRSVEHYHQNFLDFFGGDEITLPGYRLSKKLTEFQEYVTQKQIEASGIDPSKSLDDLVAEAGTSEEEIAAAAEELGADAGTVKKLLGDKSIRSQPASKMAAPQVELPAHLKQAEQVSVIAHPRWGQAFLPTYQQFQTILQTNDPEQTKTADRLVRQYLENPEVNRFIWHRLAQQYPKELEQLLQSVLDRPGFKIESDLDPLLDEFDKPIEPDLPEVASVPLHLHELFQDAVSEVSKEKAKAKPKNQKAVTGFKR